MFKKAKQQTAVAHIVLACQIAWMPYARFQAMIHRLEQSARGNPERAAYLRKVVSLARLCRMYGPFAVLFMHRRAVVTSLKNAYMSSNLFWQMNQLGR